MLRWAAVEIRLDLISHLVMLGLGVGRYTTICLNHSFVNVIKLLHYINEHWQDNCNGRLTSYQCKYCNVQSSMVIVNFQLPLLTSWWISKMTSKMKSPSKIFLSKNDLQRFVHYDYVHTCNVHNNIISCLQSDRKHQNNKTPNYFLPLSSVSSWLNSEKLQH